MDTFSSIRINDIVGEHSDNAGEHNEMVRLERCPVQQCSGQDFRQLLASQIQCLQLSIEFLGCFMRLSSGHCVPI